MAVLSFLTYLRGIYKMNLTQSSKVHYAVIQSIYDLFVMAKGDIDLMRLEMCLSTATGKWLDTWGEYFAIFRKSGEKDATYSRRIIDSIIKPKTTIPALKDNIVDYLNTEYNANYERKDVVIVEPWMELSKYSHKGVLSSTTRMASPDYYCHAVIDISIPENTTEDLKDLVKAIKAAGVQVMWTVINQYDIPADFKESDNAWVAYHRRIDHKLSRNLNTGLVLSNSSLNKPTLSGSRDAWVDLAFWYYWFAKVKEKNTDESILITERDLFGLISEYLDIDMDNLLKNFLMLSHVGHLSEHSGSMFSLDLAKEEDVIKVVKVTDELIKSFEILDRFLTLSQRGALSVSSGIMYDKLPEYETYIRLIEEVNKFKEKNRDYYDAVQPPIMNGEPAKWLVPRRNNWLWATPIMTHQDFFKYWEPMPGYEEHTIDSIIEYEDAYENGYLTFGEKYQSPVVTKREYFMRLGLVDAGSVWLWDSVFFTSDDLADVYANQFPDVVNNENYPDLTIEDIIALEDSTEEGYSSTRGLQPPIEVTTVSISS